MTGKLIVFPMSLHNLAHTGETLNLMRVNSLSTYTLRLRQCPNLASQITQSLTRQNICIGNAQSPSCHGARCHRSIPTDSSHALDRKSTRLNSSHMSISYAVFCLKKKKKKKKKKNIIKKNQL